MTDAERAELVKRLREYVDTFSCGFAATLMREAAAALESSPPIAQNKPSPERSEAPSGWVSVPREPTYEMVQAGAKLVKDNLPYHTGTKAIYKAMLSAIEAAPGEK